MRNRNKISYPQMRHAGWLSLLTAAICCMVLVVFPQKAISQNRSHSIFFEGTDYELHVYRIFGKLPGKTLLLIGGIQGDEPGGFLSADHYADISLAKGNLIVVPRANFQSIVLRRRKINEDMNRKFDEDRQSNYEARIVGILKKLIRESDCLLNLHDGSGFYSHKWEAPNRNPMKYGQSIIADAESYKNPKTGETIHLGKMARAVIDQVNQQISNPQYHFHFNNHRTREDTSIHKEQRKSATYYALYSCGIPAFGIETSKALPLEMKVRHHNLAINAFMERFQIIPETPGLNIDSPRLDYLVISINERLPVVVQDQQTLQVNPGDTIEISHIEANYERGLTADIIGYGTISDMRKKFHVKKATRIVVRKDYYPCGSVNIELSQKPKRLLAKGISVSGKPHAAHLLENFRVRINGTEHIFQNHAHARLTSGDLFEIVDVSARSGDPSLWVVNFKGFVGDKINNTGEDRGYVINTGKDLWKRYSLDKKGKRYQVVVTYKNKILGRLYVDLESPGQNRN
ncbi:MAG: succinylglutamate desuccinylase/aspartoacylase family protein [Deltaproteobacteria bacterium]|nr:succinylglutamate desuccinylase/aspartoacylase family protein [Deltaproteobacteria bacterium]